jgi:hypothetical protein
VRKTSGSWFLTRSSFDFRENLLAPRGHWRKGVRAEREIRRLQLGQPGLGIDQVGKDERDRTVKIGMKYKTHSGPEVLFGLLVYWQKGLQVSTVEKQSAKGRRWAINATLVEVALLTHSNYRIVVGDVSLYLCNGDTEVSAAAAFYWCLMSRSCWYLYYEGIITYRSKITPIICIFELLAV